jgi:predicted phosphodiesterase
MIDAMKIDTIYNLGDVTGYYSEVNECCDELRARNVVSVMGNHDWYLATGTPCKRSRSVNDCLAYQKQIITAENLAWIQSLPPAITTDDINFVHGGWNDNIDEYLTPSISYFKNHDGRYFVSGHTHKQCVENYGDKMYCNPGSVGQPRDGDNRAAFAVFDGGNFLLQRTTYDIDRTCHLMDEAGFNGYYYGCLYTGAEHLQWRVECNR